MTFDLSRDGRSRSIQRMNMLRSRYATLQNPHVRLFSCPLLFPRFSRSPCSHCSLCTLRFFLSSVIFMFPVLSFSWFSLYSQILRDLRVPCSLVLHVLCSLRFFPFSVIFVFPVLSFSMFSLYSQILPFLRDLHVPCSLVLHVLTVLSVLSGSSFPP